MRDTSAAKLIADIQKQVVALQQLQGQLGQAQPGSTEEKELIDQVVAQQAALNALLELQATKQDEINAKRALENEELTKLKQTADEALAAFNRPIEFGLTKGVEDFINQSLDMFTKFREIVANSFVSLSQVISSSITDALTGEGGNFRERFRGFLKGVANQIINMLVQVAIAKALLRLGFLGGGQMPSFASLLSLGGGFAKGGKVKDTWRPAMDNLTRLFSHAKGFALGGVPTSGHGQVPSAVSSATREIVALKPKSVDPRDRVPIWASPGEWVLRAKAVKLYGADVMDRLNSMLVDPTALRAIAGVTARGQAMRTVSRGAIEGGGIATGSGAPTAERGSQEPTGPSLAIVAGTEESMQQMLHGGGNALLDFLRANRDDFMGEERGKAQ